MRLLFIGGTGLISSACVTLARSRGHDLTLVTRGKTSPFPGPPRSRLIVVDATNPDALRAALERNALGERFDAVVQFVAFEPGHVADDVVTFAPRTDQYVLVSTAATYRPLERFFLQAETAEQQNDFWEYAQKKIEAEHELRYYAEAAGLPFTVVRPAYTYGPSKIPGYVWNSEHPWTLVDRMRRGADIIVPGDGTTAWTLTHVRDVAEGLLGLLGNGKALGRSINITSDEALTWEGIHRTIAKAAGLTDEQYESQVVHVPTDAIVAADPSCQGSLRGDKMHNKVVDTTVLRLLVPSFRARIPFSKGILECFEWFEADPARQTVDAQANKRLDHLGRTYRAALRDAASAPGRQPRRRKTDSGSTEDDIKDASNVGETTRADTVKVVPTSKD
jgi:nucleoside-diphosphate-sugar epimerase